MKELEKALKVIDGAVNECGGIDYEEEYQILKQALTNANKLIELKNEQIDILQENKGISHLEYIKLLQEIQRLESEDKKDD